ncbi:MAG TPA: hypothetical protein VG816_03625 [Solirubrobacterales bacterium]|nr:hypothetical protein [Solirubrobacterales bacterium]
MRALTIWIAAARYGPGWIVWELQTGRLRMTERDHIGEWQGDQGEGIAPGERVGAQ